MAMKVKILINPLYSLDIFMSATSFVSNSLLRGESIIQDVDISIHMQRFSDSHDHDLTESIATTAYRKPSDNPLANER